MIECKNVCKDFTYGFLMRKRNALIDLNLKVEKGEIFGYLGPNGAGKTTTIKILMNIIAPTKGEVKIFDEDVRNINIRKRIGFLPDRPYFYEYLTGKEFLYYYGKLFGLKRKERSNRVEELLKMVGLSEDKNIHLGKYSQGMLQRIGLAQVLINNPDLLILDEPLTALDPIGRREFKDILINLKKEGKTIFFSSHILEDAEYLCDRVGILVKGRLIKVKLLKELIKSEIKSTDIYVYADNESSHRTLEISEYFVKKIANSLLFRVDNDDKVYSLIKYIYDSGGRITSINPKKGQLEDIFLKEIGES